MLLGFTSGPSELRIGTHSLSSPGKILRVKKTFQICTDQHFSGVIIIYDGSACFSVLISAK